MHKTNATKIFYTYPNIYCKCKKHTWLYGRGQKQKVPSMYVNSQCKSLIRSSLVATITIPQFLSFIRSCFWPKIKIIHSWNLENQQTRKHYCWTPSFKSLLHPYLKAWLNHQFILEYCPSI